MRLGQITEKAPKGLALFVLGCAVIITGLLYIMQKAEATAYSITSTSGYEI